MRVEKQVDPTASLRLRARRGGSVYPSISSLRRHLLQLHL